MMKIKTIHQIIKYAIWSVFCVAFQLFFIFIYMDKTSILPDSCFIPMVIGFQLCLGFTFHNVSNTIFYTKLFKSGVKEYNKGEYDRRFYFGETQSKTRLTGSEKELIYQICKQVDSYQYTNEYKANHKK